ncbi:transmembrane protein 176A-like [Pseudorasbora parva]|uniref:transmembrane protein 176A-like n=1 Tax=Pseudorasbora parva TaxID=51549 RepID=UPI00351E98B8
MTLTVSQGEGLTVITVTSNPKSKWPVLCQILGSLCCSPVCFVSQKMKGKLTNSHTALGVMQIIVGFINIVFGILLRSVMAWDLITDSNAAFWIGGVVLVVGIVTIIGAKFPSPCLLVIAIILNIIIAALAITAVVLYSVDLANGVYLYCVRDYYSSYDSPATTSPEETRRLEICMHNRYLIQVIVRGLDIMMIVLSALLLCVSISFCVLTGKALCKKAEDEKDPEIYKPLMEDAAAAPEC